MSSVSRGYRMLDLFCGMGGLVLGFSRKGFLVTGYDIHPRVPEIFEINGIGHARVTDLRAKKIEPEEREVNLIVGGPPCRPWSALNLRRRRARHPEHDLLRVFIEIVRDLSPEAFLMENVPRIKNDPDFHKNMNTLSVYDITWRIICYADYGAATARHRLFLVGFRRRGFTNRALAFFERVSAFRRPFCSVQDALSALPQSGLCHDPDHVWFNFRTIENYKEKYRTGKYGWYRLSPHKPAPSFGNISKTYILHPFAGNGHGGSPRVLSVREAMTIMGFPLTFRFPPGMSLTDRYQMVADTVSPVFSEICAQVMLELLQR